MAVSSPPSSPPDKETAMTRNKSRREDIDEGDDDIGGEDLDNLESIKENATDSSMRKHWSTGKFFIHPLVNFKKEEPKNVRSLALLPRSKEPAVEVLRRHGTSVINVKGKKSETDATVGQDMFSSTYLGSGWWLDLVADGHGTIGDVVADRVCQVLPFYINSAECSSLLKQRKVQEAFEIAFERTQKDIEDTIGSRFPQRLQFSGSTCVCLMRHQGSNVVHVAWVGDSKAIMIKPDGSVIQKTPEHKPENKTERKRILEMGCEVFESKHDDGVVLQKINIKGESYPAISFTRSFGDQCVKQKGVYAIPEVEQWDTNKNEGLFAALKAGEKSKGFVLLASDGVWEFMSEQEVGTFIGDAMKKGLSAEEFLPQLVAKAQSLWKVYEGEYCDDITALFIPAAAPAAVKPPVPDAACDCFAGCSVM